MVQLKTRILYIIILTILFFETCFTQVENDKPTVRGSDESILNRAQIENLLRSVRRDRYHVFEEYSTDSLMIPGSIWRNEEGYLRYMDLVADSTNPDSVVWYKKIWTLNKNDNDTINIDSLLAMIIDTNKITGNGQENYYAIWKNSDSLSYSNIYDLYGQLFVNANTNIQGGLNVDNSTFQIQSGELQTNSLDINLNNSPVKSNKYMIVANPAPASATNGDIVANRFVAFTNTSKTGITAPSNFVEIRNNPNDTTKKQFKLNPMEITGGIITSLTTNNNWEDLGVSGGSVLPSSHTHAQTDITNLKDTIQQVRTLTNSKANLLHTHIFGDVTGLKDSLQQVRTLTNGKANTVHTHVITDLTGVKDTIQQVRTLTNSKLNIVDTTNKWSAKDHTHTGLLTTTFAPLYINGNTIGIVKAGASGDGFLSAADWNTFFNKASSTHTHTGLVATANSPLSYNNGILNILQANTNRDGFLSSTDWSSFNNKVSGSGLVNYYAVWDGAKLIKYSNLYESGVGNLIYDGTIQSTGLFVNGNFQLQGDFKVFSHEVDFYNSPLVSNSYIVVANPSPTSVSNGDIVANRFVAFTNTNKPGITTAITVSTPNGNKLIEIVGGIIVSITPP